MSYRIVNGSLVRIEQFETFSKKDINRKNVQNKNAFKDILDEELNKKSSFNISNHAAQRLEDRNIKLSEDDIEAINNGLNLAEEKGAKDSLIVYKDVAFVASVKNRTIITAVEKNTGENIFTNIDSVVLI